MGYLAMPRPGDAIKWAILPSGFVLGAVSGGSLTAPAVGRALVVWAVLELLVYPARYQVNDMLGFEADQRHPGGDRGRLPGPVEAKKSRVATSAAVAVAKVAVALTVAAVAPPDVGRIILLVMAGVLLTAVAYEVLRAVATGHTGAAPAPTTPGVVAIWLVVGAGYALRGLTGVALAVDLAADRLLAAAVLIAWWAFGVGWVTSRWAVESTAYARLEEGRLVWSARAEDAREHLLALARWLPPHPAPGTNPETALPSWRPTETAATLSSPWHVAGIVAGGFAALSGRLLVDPDASGGSLVAALAEGLAATALVSFAGTRRPLVAVLGAAVLVGLGLARGVPVDWVVPWIALAAAQTVYLRQDRDSLGSIVRVVGTRVRSLVSTGAP